MRDSERKAVEIPWLESALAFACLSLLWQLFPSFFGQIWNLLDIRTWHRSVWFVLNILFVIGLMGVRFGPPLYRDWKEARQQKVAERERVDRKRKLKEERELLARLEEGRKRRRY
jgi:cytochrome c biogenesis protein ResB